VSASEYCLVLECGIAGWSYSGFVSKRRNRRLGGSLARVAVLPIFLRNEMEQKYRGVRG